MERKARLGLTGGLAAWVANPSQDHAASLTLVGGGDFIVLDARLSHPATLFVEGGLEVVKAFPSGTGFFWVSGPSNAEEICIWKEFDGGSRDNSGGGGGWTVIDSSTFIEGIVASSNGAQVVSLTNPVGKIIGVFINGIKQRDSAYTVSGSSVILPADLSIFTGDEIEVEYSSTSYGPETEEFFASVTGSMTLTLSRPIIGVYSLFINGLRQRNTQFTAGGAVVNIPDTLNVVIGDRLEFQH